MDSAKSNRSKTKLSKVCWSGKFIHFNWDGIENTIFWRWFAKLVFEWSQLYHWHFEICYNHVELWFFSVFWNKWPIKFDFRSDDTLNASNATIPHFTVNLREEWGCRSFLISLSVHAIVENGKLQNGKSMTILDERCKYRIGSALHVYAVRCVVFAKVAQMEIQPEHIKWNSNFNKIVWHFRSKSFVWTWEVD